MATISAHSIDFSSPLDTSTVKGRSVLVTGGAAGIGLACATELAAAGANVTISDLQQNAGQAVAESMLARGYNVQFVPCDVTSYAQQVDTFRKAISFGGGKLDIVIPNAGVMTEQNVFDMIPSQAPTLNSPPPSEPTCAGLDVNLRAVYNSCHLALHYFRLPRQTEDTFKPTIIFIASLAGYVGYPSSSTYSMSKFGVRGLFYSIRDRAAQASVRINLVAPWYIETAMTTTADFLNSESGALAKMTGYAPMKRVVDAVMRFSSDQSLNGRAAGIFLSGNEDIVDDLEGAYSGDVLRRHMGEAMKMVMERMASAAETNDLARTDSAQV